jgi:hypothetical protein
MLLGDSQPCARSGRRRVVRRAAAGGLSAAALILVAACGGSTSTTAPTPRQALLAAAAQSQKVTSATETLSAQIGGAQSATTTGTIQFRLKPSLQASENLSINAAGQRTSLRAIVTGSAMYLNEGSVTRQLGKPWVKLDLSSLGGTTGSSLAQLFHGLQSNDFAHQAELLTIAKNTRLVGTQTVDGESTTEYAGSFHAAEGLKALSPSLRKLLAPELQAMGNSLVSFHAWIDGQHHVRKLAEIETINGETVKTTVNVTAINTPVSVTPPPASQTATLPGL